MLSRVITTQSLTRDRNKLLQYIQIASKRLIIEKELNDVSRDIAAFIAISLIKINETVEQSVAPWEKRGYWIKSDRFRQSWCWVTIIGEKLNNSLLIDDWVAIRHIIATIIENTKNMQTPKRIKSTYFWKGSWQVFLSIYKANNNPNQ